MMQPLDVFDIKVSIYLHLLAMKCLHHKTVLLLPIHYKERWCKLLMKTASFPESQFLLSNVKFTALKVLCMALWEHCRHGTM